MKTILPLSLLFVAAVVLMSNQQAMANHFRPGFERLDQLATALEAESHTLLRELRAHRYGHPQLHVAERELRQIAHHASHLHDAIHQGASLSHLHHDVIALQSAVHHVETHLIHFRHFARHVQRMDQLIHAIDDHIHDLEHRHISRRPVYTTPVYPYGGRSLSFSTTGFSIRLGR